MRRGRCGRGARRSPFDMSRVSKVWSSRIGPSRDLGRQCGEDFANSPLFKVPRDFEAHPVRYHQQRLCGRHASYMLSGRRSYYVCSMCQEGVGRIVTEEVGAPLIAQFELETPLLGPCVDNRRLANLLDAAPARVDMVRKRRVFGRFVTINSRTVVTALTTLTLSRNDPEQPFSGECDTGTPPAGKSRSSSAASSSLKS